MIVSSIDIGTNTVLMLLADIAPGGHIRPLRHEQRTPRLGEGVSGSRRLSPLAVRRTLQILTEYAAISRSYNPERQVACATSAVRDALNRAEFLEAAERETGMLIQVLSGDEEAMLVFRGAMSGFPPSDIPTAVIDVGGGSTEISTERGGDIVNQSVDVGSVRITERFLTHRPPLPGQIKQARQAVTGEFGAHHLGEFRIERLIGVAGTATTLACLEQGLSRFETSKVSGYPLTRSAVRGWLEKLSGLLPEEILALSPVTEGRADILTAGVLILDCAMECLRAERLLVSERGLRYGLALREWERSHV